MNYKNKKQLFFILSIFSIIFLYSLKNIKIQNDSAFSDLVFSIQFEYFGMDAKQIENIITIPLEKKLFELNSIKEIKSSSEYNQMQTTIWFQKNTQKENTYLEIRKIIDELYNSLPKDVQKPKIYCSDIEEKPSICISLSGSKNFIEKNIKPKFESIDGVSLVEVNGGDKNQLNILFDNYKLCNFFLTPYDIQSTIDNINQENILASHQNQNYTSSFFFKNKGSSVDEFSSTQLFSDNANIPITQVAKFSYSPQNQTEITLLNNEQTIFMTLKCQPDSNLIKISRDCNKILNSPELKELRPLVMYDEGQTQKEKLFSISKILLQTILINSLVIFIFYQSFDFCLTITLLILTTLFWTLGSLSIFNISITTKSIAGISIAIGLIADIPLVIIEIFEQSKIQSSFFLNVKKSFKPILTSSITTLIVLIPLFYINNIIPGIFAISITIFLMFFYSTFLSMFFLPTFLIYKTQKNTFLFNKLKILKKNSTGTLLHLIQSMLTSRLKIAAKYIFLIISICSVFIILFSKKDINVNQNNNVSYISIEFNSERSMESIKKQIQNFIMHIKKITDVKFVKTEIHRGKAEIEIIHPTDKKNKILEQVSSLTNLVPEGFVYIPQSEKYKNSTSLQIAITGTNENQCRQYAEKIASQIYSDNLFSQIVLNFKEDEKTYIFIPDKTKLAKNNLYTNDIANQLRINNFGVVIGKFFLDNKETDINIKSNLSNALENFYKINFRTPKAAIPITSLGTLEEKKMPSTIYRLNSLPCAYFTVELNSKNIAAEIKKLTQEINSCNMNDEYNFVFPRHIFENKKNYATLLLIIIFCIISLLLFLLTQNENIFLSWKIILTIPATFFLPLLFRIIFYKPLSIGDIVGIILLSGITINNVIYITDSPQKTLLQKIESKMQSILITSITTIIGSLPMMLSKTDSFASDLSFFMFWGTISSILICLFLFPSIYEKMKISKLEIPL